MFLPLDYQRQPEDPLSTNAPSWARSCRHRVLAQVPWPRGRWRQWCQQMEPKIIPGRGFLCKPYKYRPYWDYCTGLSSVTNSSAVTPGCLLTQHCPQNPLSNIPLIFLEVCSRRILHQFSVSKKTWKHYQLSYLSPLKLNYSSSFARNANVIPDFLNKQLHHYNNHQDFYYFWPFPQQIKSISLQSGMGNCNFFLRTS